jgi:hypothetical protein
MKLYIPLLAAALLASFSGLKAETNGMAEFLKTKHGFFVHYVWGGDQKKSLTVGRDGKPLPTFDEFANAFDAPGFANDLSRWGVEYVILTAWHYNINPLFPSETMKKWGMENHTCKRDVLRDVINACKAKGIKVMLYTHPRDGHDLNPEDQAKTGWGGPNNTDPDWAKFDRKKWNDFTNELYQELITRYGDDIIGIFSDEGSAAGDSWRVVDYPRLRRTVKSLQPDLLMEQNWYGTTYSLDVGCKEYAHWGEFANRDGNAWPAWRMPVGTIFVPSWFATKPAGENAVYFKAEDMFRYTVLQAGANHEGGGTQWAAGNYPGGGWETGVAETMDRIAGWMKPIAPSIKHTHASVSWPTAQGTRIPDLKWGGVATRATDDSVEYIHILTPPTGGARSVQLPPPADGRKFAKAVLLSNKKSAGLVQDAQGVKLTLPEGESWNPLHTVFALKVADDSPLPNIALWKAFRGSSFPDPGPNGGSAWAFAAVDGDPSTAWKSRPDGQSEGNAPLPPDRTPSGLIDLGQPAKLSHIEVLGAVGSDVVLEVSPAPDFAGAKPLPVPTNGPSPQPEILKATYGIDGQEADVTAIVRERLKSGATSVTADNVLAGGDPAPNKPKRLRVEMKTGGQTHIREASEHAVLELVSPPLAKIKLPADTRARYIRIRRAQPGDPLVVHELRAFGKFE